MRLLAMLCAAATALLATGPLPARGFAPVRPLAQPINTSGRSRMHAPTVQQQTLWRGQSLALSEGKSMDDQDLVPRGLMEIALNTGVGILVMAGGVVGYVKKGSKASLVAGSTFGGLLMLSAYLIFRKDPKGNRLGSAVSGLLTFVMGRKFKASGSFLPAGLITGLGAVAFFYNSIEALIDLGLGDPSDENDEIKDKSI